MVVFFSFRVKQSFTKTGWPDFHLPTKILINPPACRLLSSLNLNSPVSFQDQEKNNICPLKLNPYWNNLMVDLDSPANSQIRHLFFGPAPQKTSSITNKQLQFGQVSMHIPTRQKSHISTSPNRWNFALRKLSFKERGEKVGGPQLGKFRLEQKVKIESGWGSHKKSWF